MTSRPPLPPPFLARMERLLGEEYAAFRASYEQPPLAGLRANTLKISPAQLADRLPFAITALPWPAAAFLISDDDHPGRHPYHAAGLYYLQDPSAMAVAALLDPQPGERVLDLSAAPGGKATHLAALMRNEGLLVANEPHPRRVWDLAENLERWGAANVAITNESPARLAGHFEGFFDRVLLDAPCSGEGMFRKSDVARAEWSPALVEGCAARQDGIIAAAAQMVRPGGWLAYSTCTFAPEEDEGTVARFLDAHPGFELVEPARAPRGAPGRPDWWQGAGHTGALSRTVRLWPQQGAGEGHFVALLHRAGDGDPGRLRPWRPARLPAAVEQAYRVFCRANLALDPGGERLALSGSYLYRLPPDLPDLAGLRFIHPGWWLGSVKKNRFEPSHALALGLAPAGAQRVSDLSADDPQAAAYLRGESFPSAGEDGWTLVTVDGYALGWGKRVAGRLKSHYPKGLRWA